jgi:hypothetical protein
MVCNQAAHSNLVNTKGFDDLNVLQILPDTQLDLQRSSYIRSFHFQFSL